MSPPLECILHRLDLVCFGFFFSFSFSFLHLNTRKIMEIIQRVGAIPHLTKWQNLCKHLIINSGNCDRWGKVDRVYFWLVILFSVFSSWKWIDKNYANCFEKPKKINPLKMIRFFFSSVAWIGFCALLSSYTDLSSVFFQENCLQYVCGPMWISCSSNRYTHPLWTQIYAFECKKKTFILVLELKGNRHFSSQL